MTTTRPVFFLSHAHQDSDLATWFKEKIESVFAGMVTVFVSSADDITPGEDWFEALENNLDNCRGFISLITPTSITRPWIWFELGYVWKKMTTTAIYPVCFGVDVANVPMPLSKKQAVQLHRTSEKKYKDVFQAWCTVLGAEYKRIQSRLNTKRSLAQLDDIYQRLHPPVVSPISEVQTYQDNLEKVIRLLIENNHISGNDLHIFEDFHLLSTPIVNALVSYSLKK